MAKWEYQVVGFNDVAPENQRAKLNELGMFSWELVAVREHNDKPIYYLKKPRKEDR